MSDTGRPEAEGPPPGPPRPGDGPGDAGNLATPPARTGAAPGRDTAFAALVRAMTPELVRFAAARVGEQDAVDVVAEVFEVVWRRWEGLPPDESGRRAWVYETTKRTIKGSLSRRTRHARLLVRLQSARRDAAAAADEGIVARSRVEQAIDQLPPDQAAVLRCTLLEGLSVTQTAERLGIGVSAVTSRANRAREALRRQAETWREADHDGS